MSCDITCRDFFIFFESFCDIMACRWNYALRTVLKLGLLAHTFFPRVVNLSPASLVKY